MEKEEHLIKIIDSIRRQAKKLKREIKLYNNNNNVFDECDLLSVIETLAITQYRTRYLFSVLRDAMKDRGFNCDEAWKENLLKSKGE
jgi:hypothetical protein